MAHKIASACLILAFFTTTVTSGLAQSTLDLDLPAPGTMLHTSPGFAPPLIIGVTVHPENPLAFDFIVDSGQRRLQGENLKAEASKMIKYFMASLTVPEKEMWVNLSPYEKNRIIPEAFGLTEMGRDLLGSDYLLKQLTASLVYPDSSLGKEFWNRVKTRIRAKFGETAIPLNTFNKVWIIPDKAVVYQHGNSAFVAESHLKIMLEEDYLSLERHTGSRRFEGAAPRAGLQAVSSISSQAVREVLIPEIDKEVNGGRNFANLRQIYNAMILAVWYKKTLKESLLGRVYMDRNKVKGVDVDDPAVKQKIYQRYLLAYRKGAFNYIKEDIDPATNQIVPRKYFSGGAVGVPASIVETTSDAAQLTTRQLENVEGIGSKFSVNVNLLENASRDYAMVGGDAAKIKIAAIQKTSGYGDTETVDISKYSGPVGSGKIINPRSLKLIADLAANYGKTYEDLMRKRSERLAAIARGEIEPGGKGDVEMDQTITDAYGGKATVRDIDQGDWKVDQPPEPLTRGGAILTGPWTPKMAISALSGREITPADRRLYDEVLSGLQKNLPTGLVDAIDKVKLVKSDGQPLTLDEKTAYIKQTISRIQEELATKTNVVPVRVFADLQDAKVVHGDGPLEGPQTISDIVNGNLKSVVRERDGKVYNVPPQSEWPVITIRIDDMDVSDRHIKYDGKTIPDIITSMVFAVESIHTALQKNPNQAFSLVFPKLESPEELVFALKMKRDMQDALGIKVNIPVIFMNETIEAALKLKLMLWAGRHDVAITNVGRWDKGAADMRNFWFWKHLVYGDLGKVDMFKTLMDSYVRDNLVVAQKHGALGEGGMVTLMPSEGNLYPQDDKMAIQSIVVDKLYEWLLGYNYGWVASPSYLPLVQVLYQQPRQYKAVLDDWDFETAKQRLLEFPQVPLTESGLYADVYETITYLFGYRNTGAAVAIDSLTNHTRSMFDGATGKKTNYHLWMLKNAGTKLTGTDTVVNQELLDQMIEKVIADKGARYKQFVPQSELEIAKILARALISSKHVVLWEKELMNYVIDDRNPNTVYKKVNKWLRDYNAQQDEIFANSANTQGGADAAMSASEHPTLFERARGIEAERNRIRAEEGRYFEYVNTPRQIAAIQAPIQNVLAVTQHVGRLLNRYMRRDFRNGGTTGTYGVTNQVEMEAVARAGKIMNAELTDQHLAEILGLGTPVTEIQRLREDLKANGLLDAENKVTEKFNLLTPQDMHLNGTYGVSKLQIYSGIRQVVWQRVKAIYQGGWAEIMKYFGASDQAKAPTTYLSRQPAEMTKLLIMHAKHQEAAIHLMGLNEEQEKAYRASSRYIDFYIPIVMDIDHGHGQPQQIIQVNLSVGDEGVLIASVHIEDQMLKKCGHMSRKSLVTTKDWLEAITAVREQLDAMGLHDVTITFRTDGESADVITGDDDGRDQEFLLGVTNFATAGNLARLRDEALKDARKKAQDRVNKKKLAADQVEAEVEQFSKVYDNMVSFMLDENGDIRKYEDVIKAAFQKGIEGADLEAVDALWKKVSGVVRLDKLIEQELVKEGANAKMTVAQWRAFLQTIPRTYESDYLGTVKKEAEKLGIIIHTYDGWQALKRHAPAVFNDGRIHLLWDHKATKVHEQRSDFYMIESGLPMAISRNLNGLTHGDYPWMEQKNAFTLEIMLWAMALDQGAVDLLIKENYWGLLESYGQEFKQEKGEQIVNVLRQYLIQRRISPANSFLRARNELTALGLNMDTALHVIDAVSRPKANNTSPSFRWPFAEIGISAKKLQSIIDDITKFLPSFKYVAATPEDVQKIWDDTFSSVGLKAQPVIDVKRKMTDDERKNFMTVQGRDAQFQFSTYFGEVKNHVLSQLYLQGYDEEEAAAKLESVLLEIFRGGFISDEMYVISKLQELGYGINNAFTENSQTFAGVVYDALVSEFGTGRGALYKAFGGASDTQNLDVNAARLQLKRTELEHRMRITQQELDETNTADALADLVVRIHEELVTARSHVTRLVNLRVQAGSDQTKLQQILPDLQEAREERNAISPLLAAAIDKLMVLPESEKVIITLDKQSLDNQEHRFEGFPQIYAQPYEGVQRDLFILRAALRSVDKEKGRAENVGELDLLVQKEQDIKALIEKGRNLIKDMAMKTPDTPGLRVNHVELAGHAVSKDVGGINLDPALLDLQIKRDTKGIPLPMSQQPVADMKIDGFLPVIVNIQPVADIRQLLGV